MTDLNTSRTLNLHAFETLAPDWLTKHEPRTIEHTVHTPDGEHVLSLMTEIGDGIFVAWSTCARCSKYYTLCPCKEGPQEPAYITKWRGERFERSFDGRPDLKRELVPNVVAALKDRGFVVGEQPKKAPKVDLTGVIAAAQAAQDASVGDSNDDEIDKLREALDEALSALGLTLPDPTQWHEDEDVVVEPGQPAETVETGGSAEPDPEPIVPSLEKRLASPIAPEPTPEEKANAEPARDLGDIEVDF